MKFNTPSGKIEFYSQRVKDNWGKEPLPIYHESFENRYSSPDLYKKYPLNLISIHAKINELPIF